MQYDKVRWNTKVRNNKRGSYGVYLNSKEDKSENDILLPGKQVPKDAKIGDEVEVFVYRDSEDRMIATINRPKITIGEIAPLKVIEKTKMGAFRLGG